MKTITSNKEVEDQRNKEHKKTLKFANKEIKKMIKDMK